jgi:hypothetical protein
MLYQVYKASVFTNGKDCEAIANSRHIENSVLSGPISKANIAQSKKKTSRCKVKSSNNNQGLQYSRKGSKLNRWNEVGMQKAIDEYRQKEVEGTAYLRELLRSRGIPKSTLARRLKDPHLGHELASDRPTVFNEASDDELATVVLDMTQTGFPVSEVQVTNLATKFANADNLRVFS